MPNRWNHTFCSDPLEGKDRLGAWCYVQQGFLLNKIKIETCILTLTRLIRFTPSHARSAENCGSDLIKLDSFTLETSEDHLISKFLRNGRVRVK